MENYHSLASQLGSAQPRLSGRLRLFLPARLIPLFLLLLICKCREPTSRLPNLNILEWLCQGTGMLLDKRRVEWFVLMSFDDVFDDLGGEVLEIFFCAWVCRDERVEFGR